MRSTEITTDNARPSDAAFAGGWDVDVDVRIGSARYAVTVTWLPSDDDCAEGWIDLGLFQTIEESGVEAPRECVEAIKARVREAIESAPAGAFAPHA